MNKLVAGIGLAVAAAFATAAVAQTATMQQGSKPGMAVVAQTVKMTATITAIDATARTVTLKAASGHEETIVAGPEVKNFAQMKVGDTVDAEYMEAISLELKKGGKAPVARTEDKGAVKAKPGEAPAGAVAHQVKIVADVVAIDPVTQVVTLKGPNRTVDVKVKDPAQFKLVKVGDQVEANYTEAFAIAVTPSKAAPRTAPKPDSKPAPKK